MYSMSKPLSRAMRAARLITVSIPAHPEFLFDALHGSDGLSTLSDYTVRLLHRSMQVDVRSLRGQSLTITLSTAAAPRYLNRVMASATVVRHAGGPGRYCVCG